MQNTFQISQNKINNISAIISDHADIIEEQYHGDVVEYFLNDIDCAGTNTLSTYFTESQIEAFENLDASKQIDVWIYLRDWIESELANFYI